MNRRMRRRSRGSKTDLSTTVGSVTLPNPVMTASGTAGHSTELGSYLEIGSLGAFVAKSLAAFTWPGNPAPRLSETPSGMLNSVGLQGPGVEKWLEQEVPELISAGVSRIVASIWGRNVEEYARAAEFLADAPPEVIAVEVNLSCPNTEAGRSLFAHNPAASAEVVSAVEAAGRPRWAKLSPNTDRLSEVAAAVHDAGVEAVTLINTLMGMIIDVEKRRPLLGGGAGGLSGPAIHPVAVKAIWDVYEAVPGLPIVGAGGVRNGVDAIEMILAGASAVQVGTASFADPGITHEVQVEMGHWCADQGVSRLTDLIGGAHG